MMKEALLQSPGDDGRVRCSLCSHRCLVSPEKTGLCGVRLNRDGTLYTLVYGEVIAAQVDPIEKKPLYHFLPGTLSYSVAAAGCNFRCAFCQNWSISQVPHLVEGRIGGRSLSPREAVDAALRNGCKSLSYTYTEPTIYFEYALDTARLARDRGLANVFVTNGYMTAEALEMIRPYLDACNIDLKSFRDDFYREMCRARLRPVLDSIRLAKDRGIWVEVTTLIIPGRNDGEEELGELADFLVEVDPDIPWHISRYHPDFQYDASPPTPVETLRRAAALGRDRGLKHIYIGNVLGESEDTFCGRCGATLLRRRGFRLVDEVLEDSRCPECGQRLAGVFRGDG